MSQMIQALERRMLMSVTVDTLTADMQTIKSDAAAVVAARIAMNKTVLADARVIAAAVRQAETKSNRPENTTLLAALLRDDNLNLAKIVYGVNGLNSSAKYSATSGAAFGKVLLKDPTSAAYQKYVAKIVTYATTVVPQWVTYVENQLTNFANTVGSPLGLIANLNPTLASAVNSYENDFGTRADALVTASIQVQTDTTQLTSDLGAIPT